MSSHKLGNGPLKVGIVTMNDEANVPVQTKFSMTSFQAVRMTEKSLSGSQIPSQIHEDQNLILTRMTGCGPIDCKDPSREMKIRTAKQCVMSTPSMDKRPGHLSNCKTLNLSRSLADMGMTSIQPRHIKRSRIPVSRTACVMGTRSTKKP